MWGRAMKSEHMICTQKVNEAFFAIQSRQHTKWRRPDVPLRKGTYDGYPIGQMTLLLEHVSTFLMTIEYHLKFFVEAIYSLDRRREQIPR